ncbi:Uncharacterized protein dnm_062650 [Desulfonema magnum]|uniref:Uncharacterized protein n=1 Tax=Desulfonema magnum TaxID=45655 RepID=A0A975BS45_9BACT|nr:Uncharacterized protein dnm_062650 [Desulfonema magnum]
MEGTNFRGENILFLKIAIQPIKKYHTLLEISFITYKKIL